MDRRVFMQMLGLGGMGALGTTSLPLFGSSEGKILDPKARSGFLTGHWVVKAKPLTQDLPHQNVPGSHFSLAVKRLTPMRTPKHVIGRREGTLTTSVPYDGSIRDAHRAYYLGSQELRAKFTKQSLNFLSDFHAEEEAHLVTIVHSEIQVFPEYLEGHLSLGFDCEQYAIRNGNRIVSGFATLSSTPPPRESFQDFISTFESYSEFGEYPISVPRDIDFGVLMKWDAEVVSSRAPKSQIRGILGRRWS
jgi:hypothetical protein